MTEISNNAGSETGVRRRRRLSPWLQAGINAFIAMIVVVAVGFILMSVKGVRDPGAFGELTGTIAFHVAVVVYIFSVIWLKGHRLIASLLLAALILLIAWTIISAEDEKEYDYAAFTESASLGAEIIRDGENSKILHKGFGIEMTVPYPGLSSMPEQQVKEKGRMWSFMNLESGSAFMIGAMYIERPSSAFLQEFLKMMSRRIFQR